MLPGSSSPGPASPVSDRAHRDLARAETELRRLLERQAAEADAARRGLERAVLGVRREERRLVERVEQDHRDAQLRLERLGEENATAARIGREALERRLEELILLRRKTREADGSVAEGTALSEGVAEFLRPWRVSFCLKRVSFKPSAQPDAVAFGDVRVQAQSLSLHTGGCGPNGQMCALHSLEIPSTETEHRDGFSSPDPESEADSIASVRKNKKFTSQSVLRQRTQSVSCPENIPIISVQDGKKDEGRNVSSSSSIAWSREIRDRLRSRSRDERCFRDSRADSPDSDRTFVVSSSREDAGVRETGADSPRASSSPVNGGNSETSDNRRIFVSSPLPGSDLLVFHRGRPTSHPDQSFSSRSLSVSDFSRLREEEEARLIRRFGKRGSGRADFTLPAGLHCTPRGQIFIVDRGNARVQVTDPRGNILQQVSSPNTEDWSRRLTNFWDVAVNSKGLLALSCVAERALLVFNRHGRLLRTFGGSGDGLEAPRGVTVTRQDEFLVADVRRGTLVLLEPPRETGSRSGRTVATGFRRPYLVAACVGSGTVAVSEGGRTPLVRVLGPDWNTLRIVGACSAAGPVLVRPRGVCIDADGDVLVADWGDAHRVLVFPARGEGRALVPGGLNGPRGIGVLPGGHLVVADSMNHCVKIYQYKCEHA
ncbi:uncharacterized protein LOC130926616 [Corythoichthys intestinalis]|uniref:uncharacterized protein LOC130926616 n=1 Tax=Corythoichthys intestinalis TaxID=161448 RepID=UPI0025A5DB19|nr:uncharacterized protein LOC130926616 [Corythoichthys intestinalis]